MSSKSNQSSQSNQIKTWNVGGHNNQAYENVKTLLWWATQGLDS